MNFDIVEVLTRAWKITWKYKVLWIFGMLASCGRRGSSGNSSNNRTNTSTSNGQFPSNGPFTGQMMKQMEAAFERVGHWFAEHPWVIVALILLFIFILILQIFLSTVGSVGLIRGAYQAETGVEKIQFGSLFSESLRYFWRVIGLGLTIFLPIIVMFIAFFILLTITFAGAAKASASGSGAAGVILLIIGFCCCLIPFLVVLGLYYTQSLRALVLEDLGVFASLSRGWEVFKKNIGGLLFTAVIIFIINLLIGLIIAIPVYIAMAPVLINLLQGNIDSWRPFIIAGTIVLCYSPIAWFLSGILTTYTETIWTLIFMRATQPKENVPVTLPANA